MKQIYTTSDNAYTIEVSKGGTFFVSNSCDCLGYKDTERKALNLLKKTLSYLQNAPEILKTA